MKNLHERLTKNLGRRLLIGAFFIFLGMVPAIYIWSCVPNNKPSPIPIPNSPIATSVSNIEFNTNNDYLYDYLKPYIANDFKVNNYISLNNNQYIYYDTENKIKFINSESKITPIENQKVAKAIGEFDNKELIILKNGNKFKLGLVDDKSIEYINLNSGTNFDIDLEPPFNAPFYINQASKTTFNIIYSNQRQEIKLFQFDFLTRNYYIHTLIYKNKPIIGKTITYQNGIIIIQIPEYKNKFYVISNESIKKDNQDLIINDSDLFINDEGTNYVFLLYFLPNNIYDYEKIDKAKIKIAGFNTNTNKLVIFNKQKTIYNYILENNVKTNYYIFKNYFITYSDVLKVVKKVIILDDLITDNYKYEIYNNISSYGQYFILSENDLYIGYNVYSEDGCMVILFYDKYLKKFVEKDFKNITDINLNKNLFNKNLFYIYQGNYYFTIYENNTLKVFTNDNNIANINIDKCKITRYKNNLVILTIDKCLLLNLDSKNTTEFNLKDFDFDNSNSEFINSNFDKSNILFRNVDNVSLFVLNV
ncbi:hypothetical protein SKUN_001753 (plasmid) [Spiroplasma kunkelii CR2-3x]|uniref:Uncharacterized protein n=1 Tax=Spiroplasma kunkelii CR2-3x TaxID=273035 RepID=A0A0K2JJ38_SPIKU|nr:hypothetical protein [Spiroplasma kunkelii]ALA98604.1 hypothetical protein SKUN_001753 [Spiroplasma kunkelii CR2-3x]